MLRAHWNDVIGKIVGEDPGDYETEPPSPPDGVVPEARRRFFRVTKSQVDANGNGLPDWWELQYGYQPFAGVGQSGRADAAGDPDGDGLLNFEELTFGTNFLN